MHKISYDHSTYDPRITERDIRFCLVSISSQVSERLIAIKWTWQKRSLRPYVHTRARARAHTHTHTHTHTHARTRARAHTHIHTKARTHAERKDGRERGREKENDWM